MQDGEIEPARSGENEQKGEEAQDEVHRLGIPEEREEVIDHDRDDQDFQEGSNRMEKAHMLFPQPFTAV